MAVTIDLSQVIRADSVDLELLEWAIFKESNRQRKRLGMKPFEFEVRLQKVARQHSGEMVELKYFEHHSPVIKNQTIRQRVSRAGIKYGIQGENIAIHPLNKIQEVVFSDLTPASQSATRYAWRNEGREYTYKEFSVDLVKRWLNSLPHRRNILSQQFKFLGIGCAQAQYNGLEVFYVTQNFSSTNY
ncbi:MAG: CAP domain-containing protein [bacterium]